MSKSRWDYIAKIVMIGDSACGKSSLTIRLTDDRFSSTHDVTIAAEIGSKIVPVSGTRPAAAVSGAPDESTAEDTSNKKDSNNKKASQKESSPANGSSNNPDEENKFMKLQIWDTAGQEHFRAVTRSYFRNAAGCLLVYDVTRRATFTHAKEWLDDIRSQSTDEEIVICLVGNKTDQVDVDPALREVTLAEAAAFAQEHGILEFVETSAKTGENVAEAYGRVANAIYDKIRQAQINARNGAHVPHGVKAASSRQGAGASTGGLLNLSIDANAEVNKAAKAQGACC
jgi:small GTP-binding protein